jgi:hypothetical protein
VELKDQCTNHTRECHVGPCCHLLPMDFFRDDFGESVYTRERKKRQHFSPGRALHLTGNSILIRDMHVLTNRSEGSCALRVSTTRHRISTEIICYGYMKVSSIHITYRAENCSHHSIQATPTHVATQSGSGSRFPTCTWRGARHGPAPLTQ